MNVCDSPRSGRPVMVTGKRHRARVDEIVRRHVKQLEIATQLGISEKKRLFSSRFVCSNEHSSLCSSGAKERDKQKKKRLKICYQLRHVIIEKIVKFLEKSSLAINHGFITMMLEVKHRIDIVKTSFLVW